MNDTCTDVSWLASATVLEMAVPPLGVIVTVTDCNPGAKSLTETVAEPVVGITVTVSDPILPVSESVPLIVAEPTTLPAVTVPICPPDVAIVVSVAVAPAAMLQVNKVLTSGPRSVLPAEDGAIR